MRSSEYLHPETLSLSLGYHPEWSEGAIKPPIFQSSTFVFRSAAEGKAYFEVAYGKREAGPSESLGLIYSRLNNPNVEILEDRLCVWDEGEAAAAFESGMAAIFTTLITLARPGQVIAHSEPLYGGTEHLIREILPQFGIRGIPLRARTEIDDLRRIVADHGADGVAAVYVESPANPTNTLFDISGLAAAADAAQVKIPVIVDNTYLGPIWQRPLALGADLALYSATKYIGGHSDLIAGAVVGQAELVSQIKAMRTFNGSVASPWTAWLLLRSLETLRVRMDAQAAGARRVADFLRSQPEVERVAYLGHLEESDPYYDLYRRQCLGAGAMLSIWLRGDEAATFRFLDALEVIKLAVSLGSTESLIQHPASMTHCDVPAEDRARLGITDSLARLSIGLEHPEDLITDLSRALSSMPSSAT